MIYFFDGTIDGFLTAFVCAFNNPNAQLACDKTQLLLGQEPIYVQTDVDKAQRARARLLSFDTRIMRDISYLLRSGENNSEQVAFTYVRRLAQAKKPVREALAFDDVFDAVQRIKRVALEIHRFHGFIRFTETASGVLYAPFAPDNDICDLLAPHFCARLGKTPFVIHDVKRKKAVIFNGERPAIASLENADIFLSENEHAWQTLWKTYYSAVNIPSRERIKQMRGYMPVRYYDFLTELQP